MNLAEITQKSLISAAVNANFLRDPSFFDDLSLEKIEWSLQRKLEVIMFDFFMVFTAIYVALVEVADRESVISRFENMFKLQILELFGDGGLEYVEENLTKRIKLYKEQMTSNEGQNIYHFLAKEFVKNLYGRGVDESRDLKITMGVSKIFQLDYQNTVDRFNKIVSGGVITCPQCGCSCARVADTTARRMIDGKQAIHVGEHPSIWCENCGKVPCGDGIGS